MQHLFWVTDTKKCITPFYQIKLQTSESQLTIIKPLDIEFVIQKYQKNGILYPNINIQIQRPLD